MLPLFFQLFHLPHVPKATHRTSNNGKISYYFASYSCFLPISGKNAHYMGVLKGLYLECTDLIGVFPTIFGWETILQNLVGTFPIISLAG